MNMFNLIVCSCMFFFLSVGSGLWSSVVLFPFSGIWFVIVCCSFSFQWDLVCDRSYLVETSQSLFCFGVMMGAIVFTTLADKVGRKPVHLGCQYAMLGVGVAIAFAPSYSAFLAMRFLLGALREVSESWSYKVPCM